MNRIIFFFKPSFNYFCQILLLLTLACSEPFSFDIEESKTIVVDGKLTTERGKSYIRIFRVLNYDQEFSIPNLDVKVISDDGEIFPFRYSDDDKFYCSTDFHFAVLPGSKYRMEALDEDGNLITSAYDSVPTPIDFDVILGETTASIFDAETNVIVEKRATTVSVKIPLTDTPFYSRLKFRGQIDDFFSPGDSLGFNNSSAFALYKSIDDENVPENVEILIGQRIIDKYFVFVNPSCSSIPRGVFTTNVLPLNVRPGVPTIGCYQYEEFWWITYEITVESLSKSTYEYWENVEKLSENDGLIFDTYPFPLVGNVSCDNCENQVVGSFRAVSESVRKENWR